jgi:3-hydroxyisobutyrate dehydrogenase-like beta-hydroxyacid dehydrogenase
VEIGFIGLGAMGMPMARNIAERLKIRPRIYDTNPKALEAAKAWGEVCVSPREVPREGGIVLSMLPADAHVKAVALGENGITASPVGSFTYADFSTISPDTITSVGEKLAARGVQTIGGACTLGVAAAEKGTLSIYVDGDQKLIDAHRPVFSAFAETITYIGELGQAKLIKLMNNYFAGVNVALTAEALQIGMKAGIDAETLVKTLEKGSADSYVLRNHFEKFYLKDDMGPGRFGVDYILKDINILIDYCRANHAPLMVGATTAALYRGVSAAGYGKHYYPIILRWLQETTGAKE